MNLRNGSVVATDTDIFPPPVSVSGLSDLLGDPRAVCGLASIGRRVGQVSSDLPDIAPAVFNHGPPIAVGQI
jgi:hypothetical protein